MNKQLNSSAYKMIGEGSVVGTESHLRNKSLELILD